MYLSQLGNCWPGILIQWTAIWVNNVFCVEICHLSLFIWNNFKLLPKVHKIKACPKLLLMELMCLLTRRVALIHVQVADFSISCNIHTGQSTNPNPVLCCDVFCSSLLHGVQVSCIETYQTPCPGLLPVWWRWADGGCGTCGLLHTWDAGSCGWWHWCVLCITEKREREKKKNSFVLACHKI